MTISTADWKRYINRLRRISDKAAEEMQRWVQLHGFGETQALVDYAFALATKYGEAAATAACDMFDAVAEASGVTIPGALPAETATYGETAKAVQGALMQGAAKVPDTVGRLVKQAGADTTLQNAERCGAEFAWVPMGDTCSFCRMLASNGWQRQSKKAMKGGHAEHIHANCDCQYAVRFDGKGGVAGYDPDKYKAEYDAAEGDTWQEKLNSMRREQYAANRDKINEQKRVAYDKGKQRSIGKASGLEKTSLREAFEDDIIIPRSLGAKARDVLITLPDGTETRLTPGTSITNVQTIAGAGRNRQIDVIDILLSKYEGTSGEKWKKKKGIGFVDYQGESYRANIHWYEEPSVGRVEYKVKPDAAGNWFYEDE